MKYLAVLFMLCTPVSLALAKVPNWQAVFNDAEISNEFKNNINAALPKKAIAPVKKKHKVLIFSGSAGHRHKSIPTGKYAFEQLGLASGVYESVVSHDPKYFEADRLKTFDTVILVNSTGHFFMPTHTKKKVSYRKDFSDSEWAAFEQRHDRLIGNLVNYVKNGGGLVGVHAATDACGKNKNYGELIGGYFAGHPWTAGNQVTLTIEDHKHPVNALAFGGMENLSLKEEIYQFRAPYSREKLKVLLSVDLEKSSKAKKDLKRKDNDYAVAWLQRIGKGRVFYTSLGHRDDVYWNPLILKHYLAGIQYTLADIDADATPSGL